MKAFVIGFFALWMAVIGYIHYHYNKNMGVYGPVIEQEMRVCDFGEGAAPHLVTYVWYKGDIAELWYDKIETLTDSIKAERMAWAEDLVRKIELAETK